MTTDELLEAINDIAEDADNYSYGLPMFHDYPERFRKVIAEHDAEVRRKAIEEVASYWECFPPGEIDGQFVAEWTRQNFK